VKRREEEVEGEIAETRSESRREETATLNDDE
jgi:hypothetical protein